ncbi:uncharacterized protein LOC111259919 [Varroa jacobsoni]|uniref:uncharacterized protein LOC111259919 n=1 Tax=Varroa jacobsoni TaxID=62625 RepID=UPI000BF3A8CD|nr:uncharacterized protein LOC111259919 [Varroa jacobsoni]
MQSTELRHSLTHSLTHSLARLLACLFARHIGHNDSGCRLLFLLFACLSPMTWCSDLWDLASPVIVDGWLVASRISRTSQRHSNHVSTNMNFLKARRSRTDQSVIGDGVVVYSNRQAKTKSSATSVEQLELRGKVTRLQAYASRSEDVVGACNIVVCYLCYVCVMVSE